MKPGPDCCLRAAAAPFFPTLPIPFGSGHLDPPGEIQGRTLDELVANLREAIALHLEGEDRASVGVVAEPRISLTYEVKARTG